MENVKIYHSLGRGPVIAAICFIVAGLCELIAYGLGFLTLTGSVRWTPSLIGLFGVGLGFSFLIPWWKEKNKKIPFLEVTDDKVVMNSLKSWEIPFSEVEEFFFTDITKQLIGIRYKENVEAQKLESAHSAGNAVRQMNKMLIGAQEGIPTYRLSMKPQPLLDLLNQRLEAYRSTHA
ncbi:MAG: hypothetical protein J6T13_02535 [Bacteroidales bacterium]|nr:hypothetical protein [Bacteroidales bacterium]